MARLIAALVMAAFLLAPSARADEPPPPWYPSLPPPPVKDLRLPTGVALVIAGAIFGAGGATLIGDAEDGHVESNSVCPPTGCTLVTTVEDDLTQQAAGVGMLVGGIGSALFGAAVIGNVAAENDPFPHRSSGRVGAGILLTGLGVGTTLGGVAIIAHAAARREDDPMFAGIIMFLPATGMLATGLPLWITGSRPPEGFGPDASGKEVLRSPIMATTGLGMVVAGMGTVATGIGLTVDLDKYDPDVDEFGNISRRAPESEVVGLTMTTAGVALISLGLPLAIIGLGKVPAREAHAWVPELSVGLGGAQIAYRF